MQQTRQREHGRGREGQREVERCGERGERGEKGEKGEE